MFNKNFYPTPDHILDRILSNVDLKNRIVLEPSSGKGDIIDYLKNNGVKDILCCELDPELAKLSASKARLVTHDFLKLTDEQISHINLIIANPPFSADERHILHMWNIAPEGCEIISLCNWETLANDRYRDRQKLNEIVKENGYKENLGNIFSDAERETDINIGFVHLFKPRINEETEFEGYFDLSEEYELQENGIMQYNEIRDIVNRYVGAVKMYDSVISKSHEINDLMNPINSHNSIVFGSFQKDSRGDLLWIDRNTFKKELQKNAWKSIFDRMNMHKYVTQSVMKDINKFVEQQVNVPFTMRNIYKMIEMIIGTNKSRMERVLVEAFEKICSYSKDNSEAGEGWKTNSSYKINKNFIKGWVCEHSFDGGLSLIHGCYEELDDIVKALCFISGKRYEEQPDIWKFVRNTIDTDLQGNIIKDKYDRPVYRKLEFGKWYKWNDFFEIKGFKKRTMHFRFIDDNVWYLFNKRVSEIKGWRIPERTNNKTTGKERSKKFDLEVY